MGRYIPDNNLSYPVLIEIGESTGSGFFFMNNKKVFLATAKHVLYQEDQLIATKMKLTSYDDDITLTDKIVTNVNLTKVAVRKSETKDIVVVEIAQVAGGDERHELLFMDGTKTTATPTTTLTLVAPELLKFMKDVMISNEVFIIGYPNSLALSEQIQPDRPLLRKGIIAGVNSDKDTIILDCPVYYGNSGGLALEAEHHDDGSKSFHVIGIVSQYIPFMEILQSLQHKYANVSYENSGYSVVEPIDSIIELTSDKPEKSAKVKGKKEVIKLDTAN